jgi:hypothetical protein
MLTRKAKRIGQPQHGLPLCSAIHAAFERADAMRAQARALCQRFLGEFGIQAMAPYQIAEGLSG